ncbi:MAG TPA: VOC family protein [Chloroflexota bacterium]|jgi:catechol 2,3-dioxygenase-like lactoylglutathione lyase family enzyme
MARIKHVAIRTPDPEKTAAFYKEVFGLEEVGKALSGYYLSDGYINLAILKSSDQGTGASPRDMPGYAGIDHLGFLVDDVDETCRRLEAAGATVREGRVDLRPATASAPGAYFETKYEGPDRQLIDISGHGWVGTSR